MPNHQGTATNVGTSCAFTTRADTWTGREGTAVVSFDGISDLARLEPTIGLSSDPACPSWFRSLKPHADFTSVSVHASQGDA